MSSALAHSSARVLEFESLRDLLRGYASSPLGQGRIAALAPSADRVWIESQQALASEIREFRRVGGRFDFSALVEIGSLLEKSRIAGAPSRNPCEAISAASPKAAACRMS
jgi:DNA mismatch repair protein MutS2